MRWAGKMVQMADERLAERAETKKEGGCRNRGRPRLRWEDCVKISRKGRGGRQVERKGQQPGVIETITKAVIQRGDKRLA